MLISTLSITENYCLLLEGRREKRKAEDERKFRGRRGGREEGKLERASCGGECKRMCSVKGREKLG